MIYRLARPRFAAAVAVAAVLSASWPAGAAQRPPTGSAGRQGVGEPAEAATVIVQERDAEQTRERLNDLLRRHPPALGGVLKLDPSLMTNPAYLAPYPSVAAFLAQHPEVARNPDYFLERINTPHFRYDNDPAGRRMDQMNRMLSGLTAFLIFLVVTGVIVWLIRMIVVSRRWNRLSKVQYEVHNKLLDRFTSNDDLLAYVQTPAGRRFLESAPIPLQDEPAAISAPFSRILWSVQAGVVLTIAGLGVLYVSTRFEEEAAQFFMVIGVLTVALGAGFIVSAAAAYALSRKLGLLDPPTASHA